MGKPICTMIVLFEMEHLLHRFLNGLLDQKAWQQIECVKDPANIDDALDEVLTY